MSYLRDLYDALGREKRRADELEQALAVMQCERDKCSYAWEIADAEAGRLRDMLAKWGRQEFLLQRERDEAVAALNEFRDGLTKALNDHGVPAMPSWRAAIDYLAEHGGAS